MAVYEKIKKENYNEGDKNAENVSMYSSEFDKVPYTYRLNRFQYMYHYYCSRN